MVSYFCSSGAATAHRSRAGRLIGTQVRGACHHVILHSDAQATGASYCSQAGAVGPSQSLVSEWSIYDAGAAHAGESGSGQPTQTRRRTQAIVRHSTGLGTILICVHHVYGSHFEGRGRGGGADIRFPLGHCLSSSSPGLSSWHPCCSPWAGM